MQVVPPLAHFGLRGLIPTYHDNMYHIAGDDKQVMGYEVNNMVMIAVSFHVLTYDSFEVPTTIRPLWRGIRWRTVTVKRMQWKKGFRVTRHCNVLAPSLAIFKYRKPRREREGYTLSIQLPPYPMSERRRIGRNQGTQGQEIRVPNPR